MDLPTIIETHKTLDNKVLYKTGDISQMVVCTPDPISVEEEEPVNINEMTAVKKKELYKKFLSNHGSKQRIVWLAQSSLACKTGRGAFWDVH